MWVTGSNFFEPLGTFCCSLLPYCRWYRKLMYRPYHRQLITTDSFTSSSTLQFFC